MGDRATSDAFDIALDRFGRDVVLTDELLHATLRRLRDASDRQAVHALCDALAIACESRRALMAEKVAAWELKPQTIFVVAPEPTGGEG